MIRSGRKQGYLLRSQPKLLTDPSDLTLIKESSDKLKEFNKICKDKQNEYWEKKNDYQ